MIRTLGGTAVVLEQMLAGVSTRRFSRTREPVGQRVVDAEHWTPKLAVSRESSAGPESTSSR